MGADTSPPPSATRPAVVRLGDERLLTGPWRGDHRVAYVAPTTGLPSARLVREGVARLAERGYAEVVTAALAPAQQGGFLDAGFGVRERLHVLAHDLHRLDAPVPLVPLRRGRRRDRAAALAVDALAFPAFWRLDEAGLCDALRATPTARFRVAGPEASRRAPVTGYAVAGRAGSRGYLQRLAVHPHHQRAGLGTALVVDALAWGRHRGVRQVLVNTQEANHAAVALYERLGFRRQAEGLTVLARALGPRP